MLDQQCRVPLSNIFYRNDRLRNIVHRHVHVCVLERQRGRESTHICTYICIFFLQGGLSHRVHIRVVRVWFTLHKACLLEGKATNAKGSIHSKAIVNPLSVRARVYKCLKSQLVYGSDLYLKDLNRI